MAKQKINPALVVIGVILLLVAMQQGGFLGALLPIEEGIYVPNIGGQTSQYSTTVLTCDQNTIELVPGEIANIACADCFNGDYGPFNFYLTNADTIQLDINDLSYNNGRYDVYVDDVRIYVTGDPELISIPLDAGVHTFETVKAANPGYIMIKHFKLTSSNNFDCSLTAQSTKAISFRTNAVSGVYGAAGTLIAVDKAHINNLQTFEYASTHGRAEIERCDVGAGSTWINVITRNPQNGKLIVSGENIVVCGIDESYLFVPSTGLPSDSYPTEPYSSNNQESLGYFHISKVPLYTLPVDECQTDIDCGENQSCNISISPTICQDIIIIEEQLENITVPEENETIEEPATGGGGAAPEETQEPADEEPSEILEQDEQAVLPLITQETIESQNVVIASLSNTYNDLAEKYNDLSQTNRILISVLIGIGIVWIYRNRLKIKRKIKKWLKR